MTRESTKTLIDKVLARHAKEYPDHDDGFVTFGGRYWGMGEVKRYMAIVNREKISPEVKILKRESVSIKKPDVNIKCYDFFTYGGYCYMMEPLLDLDLMAPIKEVYIVEYTLTPTKGSVGEHDFDGIWEDEEQRKFFMDPINRTIVLEDANGDGLFIATCGETEKRKKFVEGFETKYDLETFMIRTADTFGDF